MVAALVIILSHSYSLKNSQEKKATTEQTGEQSDKKIILSAPADAVPQASVVRVDEQVPVSILEILGEPQHLQNFIPRTEVIFAGLFKTLFRVIIAPNAP